MGIYIIIFAVGMVFGSIFTAVAFRLKRIGTLRVDTSDPYEEPYLFLEIENRKNISDIQRRKYVLLNVNIENYITQK